MEFDHTPSNRPMTGISIANSTFSFGRRRTQRLSRPRTANFSSLKRPWTSYGASKPKPRISGPMDFRRVSDPLGLKARPQFRPLELSIYLPTGRLSPLPDFTSDDWASQKIDLALPKPAVVREWDLLADNPLPDQNFALRSNPISKSLLNLASSHSAMGDTDAFVGNGPGPTVTDDAPAMSASAIPYFDDDMPSVVPIDDYMITLPRPPSSARPRTSSSLRRSKTPDMAPRSISDIVRPLKSSNSIRKIRPSDVDDEIRELNTIVEERRTSARQRSDDTTYSRPPPANAAHHIPAIAPSMRLRARSETLSDIGSAFSIPLSANTVKTTEPNYPSSFYNASLASPPIAVIKPTTSRLRSWFTRSIDSRASSIPTTPESPKPFYQCAPGQQDDFSTLSSPTISETSTFGDDDDLSTRNSSPAGSYPPTTVTALTSPTNFSPTSEFTEHEVYHLGRESPQQRRTGTLAVKRSLRRIQPVKRGLSIDTTLTSSSVGTSILGVAVGPPAHEAEPLPIQGYRQGVGMAL